MYAHPLAFHDLNEHLTKVAGVAPRESLAPPLRILVGVDGSSGSLAAVEYARDLVIEGGGDIRLVNVQPAPAVPDARSMGERVLAPAMALLDAAQVDYRAEVAFGKRAQTLLRCAERDACSAVVLGDSGRSAFVKFINGGGVSRRVIERAGVPVVVVNRTIQATTHQPRLGTPGFAAA